MFTIVGDIVRSRDLADLERALDGLGALLERVNARVPHLSPVQLVTRDEFAGTYASAAHAVEAGLRIRLLAASIIMPTTSGEDSQVDVRIGIGAGEAYLTTSQTPAGAAWQFAADARDEVMEIANSPTWPPSLRSRFHSDDPAAQSMMNAYLLCQDQLLARMDQRDRRALLGLLDGERQVDIADALGVTQPAIARRVRDRGAMALHRALRTLPGTHDGDDLPTMTPPSASHRPATHD